MSFDRVLPPLAVGLRNDAPPVSLPRPSNLVEHKIMNDLPKSHGALPFRSDPMMAVSKHGEFHSSGMPQAHQQMASFDCSKGVVGVAPKLEADRITLPFGTVKPVIPAVSTREYPMRDRSSSTSSNSPVKEDDHFCLCQPEKKVPRPRNAFILYRQHYQAAVVAHNPGLANPEISKIIGEQWRNLPEEDKKKWRALAEEEKVRHGQQYPNYRYQPRRLGRDGGSRPGISHNPSGRTHCSGCGGRIMNAPSTPMTPFTPTAGTPFRSSSMSAMSPHPTASFARSSQRREKDPREPPKPIRVDRIDARARHRHPDDHGVSSPDMKRRRISPTSLNAGVQIHRDRSPESPYPLTPYTARLDSQQARNMIPMLHPQRSYSAVQGQSHPEPSLKLPPLQTSTPVATTPLTPFSQDSSVETTVMTIPFLNKIKVLAKISPPLLPSFRETNPPARGPVIAVDGQDPVLVQNAVDYLERLLKKEEKYQVRVFDGPDIQAHQPRPSDAAQMGDAAVDYLNTISAWHRISDEIVHFVKSVPQGDMTESHSISEEDSASVSPRTVIAKTATLQIHSPAQSSENGSETSTQSASLTNGQFTMPIALVPRYQLTTADAFACSIPINDSYGPLDHWQWMASLWRTCVGPDITVYIRECSRDEFERAGGHSVEVRLQDVRSVILRKVVGSSRELEEKALKRVGFEIEDFLN